MASSIIARSAAPVLPSRASLSAKRSRAVSSAIRAQSQAEIRSDAAKDLVKKASLSTAIATLAPSAAWAEEAAARAPPSLNPFAGLSQTEVVILLAPVTMYSIFTLARTANPNVKLNDILFGVAAVAVFGNIFSILVLKVKVF